MFLLKTFFHGKKRTFWKNRVFELKMRVDSLENIYFPRVEKLFETPTPLFELKTPLLTKLVFPPVEKLLRPYKGKY